MPKIFKRFFIIIGLLLILFGLFGLFYVYTSGRVSELFYAAIMLVSGVFFMIWGIVSPKIEDGVTGSGVGSKIEFNYSKDDFFKIVDVWAIENGFKLKESSDVFKLYNKGSYLSFNAHPSVLVQRLGDKVTIEAWINPIFGGKMEIGSVNYLGSWAKAVARQSVNKLLLRFNQTPIS